MLLVKGLVESDIPQEMLCVGIMGLFFILLMLSVLIKYRHNLTIRNVLIIGISFILTIILLFEILELLIYLGYPVSG